nr:Haloacid dehalogenase hydrolase domain containing protein [Haemonchus contortus]
MPPTALSRDEMLKFETYLFDADGTLWEEHGPMPGAVDFVSALQIAGKRLFLVSNNPNRSMDQYLDRVRRMGFKGFTKENVINPGIVMGTYFRDRPDYAGQPVYLLGNENVKNTLESIGNVHCFGTGPENSEKDNPTEDRPMIPKAVVSSLEPYLSYSKVMKAVNYLKQSKVEFLVTDEDNALPMLGPDKLPRSGHPSGIIQTISGRTPKVFGKPHKFMADFLKKKGKGLIDPARTIMIGDRLETDIQFANENGFTSCLVLTGVSSLEDVKNAERRGDEHLVPKHVFSFTSS